MLDAGRIATADTRQLPEDVIGISGASCAPVLSQRLTGTLHSANRQYYPQTEHVGELAIAAFRAGRGQPPELALPVYLREKVTLRSPEQEKSVGY